MPLTDKSIQEQVLATIDIDTRSRRCLNSMQTCDISGTREPKWYITLTGWPKKEVW